MTLKWIRRWARFLDVKLRLDHTLSQSTDKLRSDNSLFQIVLIERGFVIQSIILLYIKETDGRPADGAIQSRIGWEEIEDAHGTPYALRAERNWRKTKSSLLFLIPKKPSLNYHAVLIFWAVWHHIAQAPPRNADASCMLSGIFSSLELL